MKRIICFVLGALLSLAGCSDGAPAPIQMTASTRLLLASNGNAALPIVVSDQASASTRAVATELAGYLQRITGAPFEVRTGDASRAIVLGTITEFPVAGLADALAMRNEFDGKEAYVIRTEPQRILLLGATEMGASHAAFRLLETLGCRWFFPGRNWEVVPSIPYLQISLNETSRPALLSRRFTYSLFEGPNDRPTQDSIAWARHNRLAQSLKVVTRHVWQDIIAQNRAAFQQHPEYLALVKGNRQGPQLCVSNPEVRQIAAQYALNYLKNDPTADMVSMEPADGGRHCECPNCQALGSISNRVFGLANEVAQAVAQNYPGKMVGLLAYQDHSEPPSFMMQPNVYVQMTAGYIQGRYSLEELAKLWPKVCRNIGFYDYLSVWQWDTDKLPGGKGANISYLRKQIPFYVAHGGIGLTNESSNNWGLNGRGYFIANKLMWNPNADVDALLRDFYEKAFGPGAAAMQRYYERLDPGNDPLMSENLLALAYRDVAEATRLSQGLPAVQARLDDLKHYLRYNHLIWLLSEAKSTAERKDLTLAIFTHTYRSRYSYMNHWWVIQQSWTQGAATLYNEPTWTWKQTVRTPKPWESQPSFYTHEETARMFQEGLNYFQPTGVAERSFTKSASGGDLVPIRLGNSAPVPSAQTFQGAMRYAFYSLQGEPVVADITTGTIANFRDRPAASYAVVDANNTKITEGRLPLDGLVHQLQVPVPRAGLYYLDFDDSSAGWRIAVAPGRPVSIVLQRGKKVMHAGQMQPMYFYVPKGTRQIQYHWANNWGAPPHGVYGPNGQLVQEVDVPQGVDKVVTIPVPPGADGQIWHFKKLRLGGLWFLNVPNYLAASPGALLVPRELAQSDGLSLSVGVPNVGVPTRSPAPFILR